LKFERRVLSHFSLLLIGQQSLGHSSGTNIKKANLWFALAERILLCLW